MDIPLIAAGLVALVAAAIHGAGGEMLVVRKLSPATLPSTGFGGPGMTRAMIHVSWHITTVAFLTVGIAALLAGSILEADAAEGVGLVAAGAATGFGVVALVLGAARLPRRALLNHPGPIVLTAIPVLAWWGVLA